MKKCFLEAKETHPDILCGGNRNPYQLKKVVGQFFAYFTWAK